MGQSRENTEVSRVARLARPMQKRRGMARSANPARTPIRLASTITRMARDRREKRLGGAAMVASVVGLVLAVANYVM